MASVAPAPSAPLRIREVARRLGVCPRTVERLIARGEIGHCRIGRLIVVPAPEVERFLRAAYRAPEGRM